MKLLLLALVSVIACTGCSAPAVPDVSYFRMPAYVLSVAAPDEPVQALPIVVDPLRASGVYNDQSILYALKPDGSIKAYHYQLWDEAPSVLVQRRLIDTLRARRAASMVTDRLPAVLDSIRIGGTIERFERTRTATGWMARVRIELRVERDSQSAPLLLNQYGADVTANSDTVDASVRAFARAVDECLDAFWAEFSALPLR
jgi:cholesterol transport system auxiliary component